jgi:hypothetical protein
MTTIDVSFGIKCPRCGSADGLALNVGGSNEHCGNCGTRMVPDEGTSVVANGKCRHCGTENGLVIAMGGPATCDGCGKPL